MNKQREQIAQGILDMVAGVPFETGLKAQCDALATTIGAAFHLQGKTCAEAEALIRDLAEDMAIRHIRRHWGTVESVDVGRRA